MSMDKVSLAVIIGIIAARTGQTMQRYEIEGLESEIAMPPAIVSADVVDDLVRAVRQNERIAAIKAYRVLTGYGLLESKNAIERFM